MPINKGQSARLVIAFAWAIHALSWFLPAETDWLFQTTFRGWSAFGAALALSFAPPSPDSPGDPWYSISRLSYISGPVINVVQF